jgi:hypothetical protein
MMEEIDHLLNNPKCLPYWGWHNDYIDKSSNYRPALMQDREEFRLMLEFLDQEGVVGGSCLQLGMGVSGASHEVWRRVFSHVVTIDLAVCAVDEERYAGQSTHDHAAWLFAQSHAPFDFLFIDAGHSYEDVSLDYGHYQLLVRSGGVIAFHDALERDGYPEVKVHEFLKGHPDWPITVFGNEIGTAVMVKT